MALTSDHIATYAKDGYLRVPGVFAAAEIERIRHLVYRLYRKFQPDDVELDGLAAPWDDPRFDRKMIDLRAQKDFQLANATNLGLFLDLLNLTNSDQSEGVASTLGTSSSFGAGTRFVPPRRAMFGVKYRW